MSTSRPAGRLTTIAAAMIVARRDFTAILFSRSFIFFLIGPLFPVLIGALAGGIGQKVQQSVENPNLGVAMSGIDNLRMQTARESLFNFSGIDLPNIVVVGEAKPGTTFDALEALRQSDAQVAAIITGTPEQPQLTGSGPLIAAWRGSVSLIAAQAQGKGPRAYPQVNLAEVTSSTAQKHHGRVMTAQASQLLLLLLTMLLAGMVLSSMVEEKSNKIIETLAAAVPMDAVFLGKLFAMLAVSFVGIAVWAGAVFAFGSLSSQAFDLPQPAVGWPMFIALGIIYFSLSYLLVGSLFLTIGSMASTVREVQTLSMPITFLQLIFFFIASYSVADNSGIMARVAEIVPFSSPYAMLARAAQRPELLPHVVGLVWQVLCIGAMIRIGSQMFRRLVMKSGPAGSGKRGLFRRRAAARA